MRDTDKSRLALITGAAGGVGSGIALVLARAGWNLVLNDLHPSEAMDLLLERVHQNGVRAETLYADVGDEDAVETLHGAVIETMGCCPDLLINNAGVQTWKPLLELSLHEWNRTITTNLTGCFLNTRCFAQHVIADAKPGVIVNIGSGCNHQAFPRLVDYAASKGGIEMLTKTSALELGPHNIRVNCIAPGAIENERTREESSNYSDSWSKLTPLRRIGQPDDVGNAVLLLADPKADFITGQTVGVDGGLFSRAIWPESY